MISEFNDNALQISFDSIQYNLIILKQYRACILDHCLHFNTRLMILQDILKSIIGNFHSIHNENSLTNLFFFPHTEF